MMMAREMRASRSEVLTLSVYVCHPGPYDEDDRCRYVGGAQSA